MRRPNRRLAFWYLAAWKAANSAHAANPLKSFPSKGRYVEQVSLRANRPAFSYLLARSHVMSDIHSAAVLLMTLPEEEAGQLMSKLEPKQVEQVSIEIARARTISP